MKKHNIVHLYSGGLDSTVLLHDLIRKHGRKAIHCLLFDYGQRHRIELRYARDYCRELKVEFTQIELARIEGLFLRCAITDQKAKSVVVPNRNAVLLNIACAFAVSRKAETVTFGANADDFEEFPDCRPAWVQSINESLWLANLSVQVCAPFIHMSKREIVALGRTLNVAFTKTMSCYNGTNCGKCNACKLREAAIAA